MNDPFDGELTGDTAILRVRVRELESENDKLRGILAKSDLDCIYCGLPKKDMGRCYFGFPGCGRADDLMLEANDGRKPESAK
jgi:hypothetical protein